MSQENVELVRRFVVAESDEGWDEADPEIVWDPVDEESVQVVLKACDRTGHRQTIVQKT